MSNFDTSKNYPYTINTYFPVRPPRGGEIAENINTVFLQLPNSGLLFPTLSAFTVYIPGELIIVPPTNAAYAEILTPDVYAITDANNSSFNHSLLTLTYVDVASAGNVINLESVKTFKIFCDILRQVCIKYYYA